MSLLLLSKSTVAVVDNLNYVDAGRFAQTCPRTRFLVNRYRKERLASYESSDQQASEARAYRAYDMVYTGEFVD